MLVLRCLDSPLRVVISPFPSRAGESGLPSPLSPLSPVREERAGCDERSGLQEEQRRQAKAPEEPPPPPPAAAGGAPDDEMSKATRLAAALAAGIDFEELFGEEG